MKKSIIGLFVMLLFHFAHLSAQTTCLTSNIAAGKPVVSSYAYGASNAVDGNLSTIWQPSVDGDEWLRVDLGTSYTICQAKLIWDTWDSQDTFKIQISNDTVTWTDLALVEQVTTQTPGNTYSYHLVDLSANNVSARYVRIYFINMIEYNAHLEELQIYNKVPVNLPTVSVTAPADGANYTEGDSVVLKATAAETSGTISSVQFYQGSTLIGTSSTAPYSLTWKQVPEGEYLITAKAIDINGYSSASTSINVYVDYPNPGWLLNGNKGTNGDSDFVGTLDSTKLVLRTNKLKRMTISPNGNIGIGVDSPTARFDIGGTVNDPVKRPAFQVYANGDIAASTTMDKSVTTTDQNGLRYYSKLGLLQLGASDVIDTTLPRIINGIYEGTGLLMNSDDQNHIKGVIYNSILVGGSNTIDSAVSLVGNVAATGATHFGTLTAGSLIEGYGHIFTGTGGVRYSFIGGLGQILPYETYGVITNGFSNTEADTSAYSLVNGWYNTYGGTGQLVSGGRLVDRTPFGTTLGNGNVDFSTLTYSAGPQPFNVSNLNQYPLFALGNSNDVNGTIRSNALTVLYNGRTQINTTGFSTTLTQTAATPKAALEVVSTNSGVLLPKLTTTQRNAIVSGDLLSGLLLYNTDSSQFQFYNGSNWNPIGSGNSGGGSNTYLQQGGNSFDTTAIIGTKDDNPLDFYTSNTRVGRWSTSGDLLINTTQDDSVNALQVSGSVSVNVPDSNEQISLSLHTHSMFNNFESIYNDNPSPGTMSGIRFYTATGLMTQIFSGNTANAYVHSGMVFHDIAGGGFDFVSANPSGFISWGNNFKVQGGSKMIFYPTSGNLLIGTTTDNGDKLQVNGTITSKKIVVTQTGWPDYVFKKSYHLPDLPEIEHYISLHQHLPGVVSEGDATKKGVDLGGTQAVLLKKIEELTLYLIGQDKKIRLQTEQIRSQAGQIDQLSRLNEKLEKQQDEIDKLEEMIRKLSPPAVPGR